MFKKKPEEISQRAKRLREEANLAKGKEREKLIKMARRAETEAQIDNWAHSLGLSPPK